MDPETIAQISSLITEEEREDMLAGWFRTWISMCISVSTNEVFRNAVVAVENRPVWLSADMLPLPGGDRETVITQDEVSEEEILVIMQRNECMCV